MVIELGTTQLEPYVGPVPFEAKDEAVFFGREGESDELLSLAIAHPVVLMYAQSGAGKTSLLNANFVPKLKKEGYEVLPIARVQGNDCDSGTNIYVFNTLMNWAEGKVDPRQLARMTLVDFLRTRVHQKNDVKWELPRFLIFDQFEELFTAYPQRWQERKEFFVQIRDALEKDYLLRVVFAMREDYIAELDAYAELLPEKLRTRFRLERPRAKAALSAVKKPLAAVKTRRHFAEGVAEQLVQNLLMIPSDSPEGESQLGQFVEPVQLQVVCQSLWKALGPQDEVITYQHLENCGDVGQALSDFYERCINRAVRQTGVKEGELREWFGNTLITSDNTRGMVFRGPQKTGLILNSAVDVLEKLHLIKEEKRGRSRWYELAHDRFIEPIRKSNEKWWGARAGAVETRRRLEARAAEWVRRGRGSEGLLNETELLEADRWRTSPDASDLSPSEALLALISASRAAIREQAEAIRQGQLLAAEQQRRLRQFRLGLVVAAVLLIVMSGLTVFAYRKSQMARDAQELANEGKERAERSERATERARAEAIVGRSQAQYQRDVAMKAEENARNQKNAAEKARLEAESAQTEALKQKEIADTERLHAEQAGSIAQSRELAFASNLQRRTNSELALVLAREAVEKRYQAYGMVEKPAADSLHAAFQALPDRSVFPLLDKGERLISGALSADAKRLAMFTVDTMKNEAIKVWDVGSGKPPLKLLGASNPTGLIALSPDGRTLVSSSRDGSLYLWDGESGKLMDQRSNNENLSLTNLSLSNKGILITYGSIPDQSTQGQSTKKEILLWDLSTAKFGQPTSIANDIYKDEYEKFSITTATFSPNGAILALGGTTDLRKRGAVLFFDLNTHKAAAPLGGILLTDQSSVTLIRFSANGERFGAANRDGEVEVWKLGDESRPAQELFRLCSQTPKEKALAFSSDLEYFASFDPQFAVKVRQLSLLNIVPDQKVYGLIRPEGFRLVGHTSAISRGSFSADGNSLITVGTDKKLILWKFFSPGHELTTFSGPWKEVAGIAFSPDGKRLVGAIADNRWPFASLWADQTGTWRDDTTSQVPALKLEHAGKVWAVAYSKDGSLIATSGEDQTTKIWNASTGELRQTLPRKERAEEDGHKSTVREVAFSPDGTLLATCSNDTTAKIWEVSSGRLLHTLSGHKGEVWGVAFSRNGLRVATASSDTTAKVWDLTSCKTSLCDATLSLEGHGDVVWKVAFSPTEDKIATASHDGTGKVWDANTGKELFPLIGHTNVLWGISFSRDGSKIATASSDRTARIWDAKTGEELLVLTGHSTTVNRAVFSWQGNRLATSSEDGTVRIYTLDMKELIALSRERAPRELTAVERKEYVLEY